MDQFQHTNNEGGRASCQGNRPMFEVMRASQFAAWPQELLTSYLADLREADAGGRNLVTEKYARMMASTAPEIYARDLEPHLPRLSEARIAQQERIIKRQLAWAHEFADRYPALGAGMRVFDTAEDSETTTSFETYLRGELATYSQRTLDLYERFVRECERRQENLTEQIIANTVRLGAIRIWTRRRRRSVAHRRACRGKRNICRIGTVLLCSIFSDSLRAPSACPSS